MKALKHINTYFLKYKYRLILGTLITIIARIFTIAVPKFIGDSVAIVEHYLNGKTTSIQLLKEQLMVNILLILGAVVIAAFFTFLMRQTFIVVSRFIEYDLKNEVFQHYQKLSLDFYKNNRTGDLMNRISEDVSKVRMYAGPALMYSVNTITLFLIVISYMLSIAPTLTLYTLLPLPILSLAIYKLSVAIHQRSTIVQECLSRLTTYAQESFSGIGIIKAYGIENQTYKEFATLSNQSKAKNIDLVKIQALFFPLMMLLIGISNLLVIYIGGQQLIAGTIDIGVIVEFIIFVNMLTWPVATVGWVTSIVQQAEASQLRINAFLKEIPRIKNTVDHPTPIAGAICFDEVSYTYEDTQIEALQKVSFEIKPGQTVAIMGKTGSGKSTLLDLMGRLYEVEEGQILIDGISIADLNLYSVRSAIGYVPQDAFLFSDTINTNIRFGHENASQEAVHNAAKIASVHETICHFSMGYETVLGERGITLSGGQKQRIAIARAIIKNPRILLFDDCLSAVDTKTEAQILQALHKTTTDQTTIIASHRISAAKNADLIIVLDQGKIVQQGNHGQLIAVDGYYKDLYLKQLSEKES